MKKIYIVRVLEANKTWDDRSNILKKTKKKQIEYLTTLLELLHLF